MEKIDLHHHDYMILIIMQGGREEREIKLMRDTSGHHDARFH
jgi:hypothetical protein